jgi:hypothetical protein
MRQMQQTSIQLLEFKIILKGGEGSMAILELLIQMN